MKSIKAWYAALAAREQRFVAVGAGLAALALVLGLVFLPLSAAVSSSKDKLARQHEDLEWMRAHAAEVRASAGAAVQSTGEPAVVVVDRTARSAGLAAALRGAQPDGNQSVRVQLEAAPFDVLLAWLATLDRQYGLGVDSITIDRGNAPGLVNASVSFAQPH